MQPTGQPSRIPTDSPLGHQHSPQRNLLVLQLYSLLVDQRGNRRCNLRHIHPHNQAPSLVLNHRCNLQENRQLLHQVNHLRSQQVNHLVNHHVSHLNNQLRHRQRSLHRHQHLFLHRFPHQFHRLCPPKPNKYTHLGAFINPNYRAII